jgi:hypothetical protein
MASKHSDIDSDTDSDTEVDAQPESLNDQSVHNDEGPARNQQQATAPKSSTAHDDIIDEHIKQFYDYLPSHLKDDPIELLIINTETDYNNAKALEASIMKNVKFGKNKLSPNVVLLNDVINHSPCDHLDYAYSLSTIILLYVTKSFCHELLNKSQSYACLKRKLESLDKDKTIIVVHTDVIGKNVLPSMLNILPTLFDFSDDFIQKVTKCLNDNSGIILKRRNSLKNKRWDVLKPNSDQSKPSKFSVSNPKSKNKDNSKSAPRVKDPLKKNNTGIEQQLSQVSLSTEPKSVPVSRDIEPDGDVSGRRSLPQQNIEQRNSRPHTSKVDTKKRADESGYNSFAGEEPSRNYSSLQECDGDKTVPINLPPAHPKIAFNGKQSLPVSVSSDDLQSLPMDATENKEKPSTGDKHARNSASQDCRAKSFNAPAPVYNFHVNHADFVNIDSTVTMTRPKMIPDTSDADN